MGTAQVSSVVITAEVGKLLCKSEEMVCFQFGGSAFVTRFEAAEVTTFGDKMRQRFLQGSAIGHAADALAFSATWITAADGQFAQRIQSLRHM